MAPEKSGATLIWYNRYAVAGILKKKSEERKGTGLFMPYFNYHATAQRLLRAGKLRDLRVVERYHGISPALLLYFDDTAHPVMPIREHRFDEYFSLIAALYPPDTAGATREPPAPPAAKK